MRGSRVLVALALVPLFGGLPASPLAAHDVLEELENQVPQAAIAPPGEAAVGQPVSLDGSGSSDPDGSVRDYVWDFMDGSTATGPQVQHAWTRPGTFVVSLIVHDDRGAASPLAQALVRVRGQPGEPPYPLREPQIVAVPMRDGTQLTAKLFLPDAPGSFPVILTHANDPAEGVGLGPFGRAMVESGYAFLHVTARGQGTSGGLVSYRKDVLKADGYDIVEWAAAQPWSDGHHAFLGGSNYGYRGWMAATANPPHLTTASLTNTPQDVYRDIVWTGGIQSVNGTAIVATLAHGLAATQGNPAQTGPGRVVNDVQVTSEMSRHDTFDAFWELYRFDLEDVRVPVLYNMGWTDVFVPRHGFEFYRRALKRTGGKLFVWPGGHGLNYPNPIDPTGLNNPDTRARLWFDQLMKGIHTGVESWPPVLVYRMEGGWLGAYRNGLGRWVPRADWPVPGTQWTRYYLREGGPGRGGALSTEPPAPGELPDLLVPAPAGAMDTRFTNFYGQLAGNQVGSRTGDNPWPRYDAAQNQEADDAASLTFQTEPFEGDVEVTGPITLTAYVTATAPDTDLVAQVSDVWPDGHARFLANGLLRASMRRLDESLTLRGPDGDVLQPQYTFTQHEYLTPGQVYELHVEIYPTSNLFRSGHRLRLDIAQLDVPMSVAGGTPVLLHHSAQYPSRFMLPVQPGEP